MNPQSFLNWANRNAVLKNGIASIYINNTTNCLHFYDRAKSLLFFTKISRIWYELYSGEAPGEIFGFKFPQVVYALAHADGMDGQIELPR